MPDLKTKKERLSRLLAVKNEIVDKQAKDMVGKVYRVLIESEENGVIYGSLDSGKTISLKGPRSCVGEFVDVKVSSARKSVIYGDIVDESQVVNFKEKNFKQPIKVSILPKDAKGMKLLRENKQNKKMQDDKKSKKD